MVEFNFSPGDWAHKVVRLRRAPAPEPSRSTLEQMKEARRWLIYQNVAQPNGKKPRKVPHYVNGQRRQITDTDEDRARLVSFAEVQAAVAGRGDTWGLGFALGYDETVGKNWQGHDRDGSLDGMESAPGYVEKSPSGTGYHVIGLGRDFKGHKKDGREFYSHGRFFTFTGDKVSDGSIVDLMTVYPQLEMAAPGPADLPAGHPPEKLSSRQRADLRDALAAMDADNYDAWYRVALALQSVEGGFVLFDQWSRSSDKYQAAEVRKKWEQAAGKAHAHWKSIFAWASNDYGWINPSSERATTPEIRELPYESAFPISWVDVPERDWIIVGLLLRKHLSVMVAPGGTGKSILSLHLAVALATGATWGEWTPRRAGKTLIVNAEDDRHEMRRRLKAVAQTMGADESALVNKVFFVGAIDNIVMMRRGEGKRDLVVTELVSRIVETCRKEGIDVVIIDPLVEIHELEENDNVEIKAVGVMLRDALAREAAISVLAIHHTPKGSSNMAGNADAGRGASALGATARIFATLFNITEKEAKDLNIEADERLNYMRFDGAKANYSKLTRRFWLVKEEFIAPNGPNGAEGDAIGVLVPWDGASAEEVEKRGYIKESKNESKLVALFEKMRSESGLVIAEGRGNSMPIPDGYKLISVQDDLLAPLRLGKTRDRWVKQVLQRFKPKVILSDNQKHRQMVFPRNEFSVGPPSEDVSAG